MKKNIITIFVLLISILSFSQTFEEYKKSQENKFKSFKEKRDAEIKKFIAIEEDWNMLTIEQKGTVKVHIEKEKNNQTITPQKEIPIKVTTSPDYVNIEKKKTQKENISYDHPWKNSKFRLSSPFGFRIHPIYKTKRFHSGTDYAASKGIPIYSIADGTVLRAGVTRGYGNYIVIGHGNGLKSAYAHMSSMNVKNGDKVKKGDKIGGVGMTGSATGNHLHFEVIRNNKKVNPKLYVSQ